MAQRYELQVNERSTPAAFARAYPVNAEQLGINLAKMGDAQAEWAVYAQKRQAEWDTATVMNAQNEFQKQMHEYLYNPETGQMNVRKLGAARGLTDEADEQADKIIQEISGRLENNNQKNAFKNIAARLKMPFFEQASRHEAREFEQYKEQSFKANIAANSDMALLVPYSESTGINTDERALAHEQVENAIRSHMFGASEEAINQSVAEAQSDIDEKIIAVIAQDNPVWALNLLNDKDSGLKLLNEARADLTAKIKPRAEIYEVQGIADELIKAFPSGSETEALNFIRQKFSGEKEERIASAYKMRVNESYLSEQAQKQQLSKAQDNIYNEVVKEFFATDGEKIPTYEQVRIMAANGEIDERHANNIFRMIEVSTNRKKISERESKKEYWKKLTPEEREEQVMSIMAERLGFTNEERFETLEKLVSGVLDGTVDDSIINEYYAMGYITAGETARLKRYDNEFDKSQKDFIGHVKNAVKEDIRKINIIGIEKSQNNDFFRTQAANNFSEAVALLDPRSSSFRKDVETLRRDVVLAVLASSGEPLETFSRSAGKNIPTELGKQRDDYRDLMNTVINETDEYNPVFTSDAVDLEQRRNGGGLLWQSVIDARNVTSNYGLRNGKNHNGIDIGAAGGSAVKVPPISGLMVKKTVTGSYKGDPKHPEGNAVFLEGKLPNGDKIEVRMFHLQEDSITVKSGDIVDTGSVIAKVGNTGHVRGKNGGYHLHLEVLVNDKHVDPGKYLMPGAKKERKAARMKFTPRKREQQGQVNVKAVNPDGTVIYDSDNNTNYRDLF